MAKRNKTSEFSLTILRIVLGVIFIYHGSLKLFVAGGLPNTADLFTKIGIPLPNILAVIVAFLELAGGILLLLGLMARWISVLLLFEMAVALLKVHLKNGLSASKGGYEFVMLILAALIVIASSGAGKFSLGNLFKSRHLH